MPNASKRLGVLALSMLLILSCSGCATNRAALYQAAAEKGRAETKAHLPALPDDCRNGYPHAAAVLGANAVIVLARERGQLDRANGVIDRCAGFYLQIQSGMKGH